MRIRETVQEIGFYIGLILLGWFLSTVIETNKIEQKIRDRLTKVEDSISKLGTQDLIKKSLEEITKQGAGRK